VVKFLCEVFCNNYKSLKIASILTFPEGCLPSDYILPTIGNSFRFAVKHHRQGLDEHSRDYLSSSMVVTF